MKRIFFLIVLFSNTVVFGQNNSIDESTVHTFSVFVKGTFTGKVTDARSGLPLEGVSVYITDTRTGTSTDKNGEFAIRNLPNGMHLVEVSHIGFTAVAEEIILSGDVKKDFALNESVVENNAVVVTGVSRSTQLKKIPVSISVLRKQDLLQLSSTNLIESLSKQAGVSTLTTGPAISKPFIRGLGYNRVLTINDGVRQEGQQWGDEHGIEVDEQSVNKIEILRGPGSIIYGSDAMAGVINIITNVPVQEGTMKFNVLGNYQTNNNLNAWNANWAGNVKGVSWNMYGTTKAAADYQNKYDGRVFNSKFTEKNLGGYLGYNSGWGYSHILLSSFDQKPGLVEGDRDAQGAFVKQLPGGTETRAEGDDFTKKTPDIPYQRVRHFKVAADNSIRIGKSRLAFNVGWQRNQREEFGNVDDPNERSLLFDLRTTTYTAQYHLPEKAGWKLSIGGNGMTQANTNKGVEALIPDYSITDIGGYLYVQKEFNKTSFSGGLRYDNRQLTAKETMVSGNAKFNSFKKDFSNFSATAGAVFNLGENINLKINAARAFRAPSIPELASDGTHEGTNRYEYGDQNLKNETSWQGDAAIEFNTEHLSFTASAFLNSFDNFIFYRKLEAVGGGDSAVNVGGDLITAYQFSQRKAIMSGVEASLDFHPHPLDWLHIENTFSVVRGRFKEQIEFTDNMPLIPAARIRNEIRGDFKKAGENMRNSYIKLEFDNVFAQEKAFTAYNTETATTGYTLMNIGIGTDFVTKKGEPLFSLYFGGNNLADVAYQNHLSRLKYADENQATGRRGVFNTGRNYSFKINVPLSFTIK